MKNETGAAHNKTEDRKERDLYDWLDLALKAVGTAGSAATLGSRFGPVCLRSFSAVQYCPESHIWLGANLQTAQRLAIGSLAKARSISF
jgi:hypothetical protein